MRQGNGFVIGTADDTFEHIFRNITFRNSTAENTMFGCHIKFKDSQSGVVNGVRFVDIKVLDPTHYAIGIDQNGQGAGSLKVSSGSAVKIANVSFVRVTGRAPVAGRFTCNTGPMRCRGITLLHVNLDVPPSNATHNTGCTFANTVGHGLDVSPASCVPPSTEAVLMGRDDLLLTADGAAAASITFAAPIKVGVAGEPGYCYGLDADGLGTATVWMTHEVDH